MKIGLCISHEEYNLHGKVINRINKNRVKDWSEKFETVFVKEKINYEKIFIDKDDWIEQISSCDVVIWKPRFIGITSSQYFKEKIYFIQYVIKKRVFPNYETVWHFDSKIAQKYFFQYNKVPIPKTFVTFDYNEAMKFSKNTEYPIIFKLSSGAGSRNVRMIKNKEQLQSLVNFWFDNNLLKKVIKRLFKLNYYIDSFGQIYLQEFINNNSADLRITIIGDKYAFGFWRNNRDNDFRASGSGKIDYDRKIPQNIVQYLCKLNKDFQFDSMAYDIIFRDNEFVIVEMSYGYLDKAIYNANGYYLLDENCNVCQFVEGHYWPQEMWVKWLKDNCF